MRYALARAFTIRLNTSIGIFKETCKLLYIFAWQLYRTSSIKAIQVILRLYKEFKNLAKWPEESVEFLHVRCLLGICLQKERRDREAVEVLRVVVGTYERTLAVDNSNLLDARNALAGAFQANGQVSKAVGMLEHVVEAG